MTYAQIYAHFLERVRREISVRHRPLGGDMDGFYDVDFNQIIINSHIKNTRKGFRALAHEFQHFNDFRANLFPGFFSHNARIYTKERMAEVVAAEQSAGRGAARISAEYGKKYEPEETNPKEIKALKAFWRKFYFK